MNAKWYFVTAMGAGFFASSALAATSATVELSGSLPTVLSVSTTALPAASSLDFSQNNDVVVAEVASVANVNHKLTFESANAGSLVHADDSVSDVVSYQLVFNGSTFQLDAAKAFNLDKSSSAGGDTRELRIKTPATFGYAGNYSETVTVTIAAL